MPVVIYRSLQIFNFFYTPKFTPMQNCHVIAKQQSKSAYTCTLNFCFVSYRSNFFCFTHSEIVMQLFDSYNRFSILITKIFFKISFPCPQISFFAPDHFFLSPAHDSRTKGPDTLDIVICLASSSSSSEIITISSHAFSCL